MANEHPLDVMTLGVEAWNQWRREHPEILPNFNGVTLVGTDLRQINFASANLSEANLTRADLTEANLHGAILTNTNLSGTDLSGTDLSEAKIGFTLFVNNDLRFVKGLETIHHNRPSSIGTDTISRSEGEIPEVFLRKAGVTKSFITYAHALAQNPIEYYTCFISYSSQDQAFAEKLYADLQAKGVRCWFAPEDLKIGDEFRNRIDESIRLYDKLLLALSEHSINSMWVENEVAAALLKEQQQNKLVLFPMRLDSSILTATTGWAASIRRTRHIADFQQWRQHDKYQIALSRLIRDLQASTVTEVNGGPL